MEEREENGEIIVTEREVTVPVPQQPVNTFGKVNEKGEYLVTEQATKRLRKRFETMRTKRS